MSAEMKIIMSSPLFKGLKEEEISGMLKCLTAVRTQFEKDSFIFNTGIPITLVGMVLKGRVHIIKEDFWGNRSILSKADTGQIFGESYACNQSEPLMVSVVAVEKTEVLFLDVRRVMTVCSSACEFHTRLIRNLLSAIAEKNLMLTRKIDHLTQRSIREKLLSYLSFQAQRNGSSCFQIPFNRQELADYLSVDRSALSGELSKMRKEGMVCFHKNRFELR